MVCKACGHTNYSTAIKCGACGVDLGLNEEIAMFEAQAKNSKGIETSVLGSESEAPQETQTQEAEFVSQQGAEDFFGSVSGSVPAEPPPAPSASPTPPASLESEKPPVEQPSFFSNVKKVEEPTFETKIAALRPDDEIDTPPPKHPLYSAPTNKIIEEYIGKRKSNRN